MKPTIGNMRVWAEQYPSELGTLELAAVSLVTRLRDALETAAGQYGPVTDEQRNEWMALVQEATGQLSVAE